SYGNMYYIHRLYYSVRDLLLFFFFQAEDGIRDLIVTGVQTCALPISSPWSTRMQIDQGDGVIEVKRPTERGEDRALHGLTRTLRSEERRVGKECRCRRGASDQKKKSGEGE